MEEVMDSLFSTLAIHEFNFFIVNPFYNKINYCSLQYIQKYI